MGEPETPDDLVQETPDDPEQLFRGIGSRAIDTTTVVMALLAIPAVALSLAHARDGGWHGLLYIHLGISLVIWATAAFRTLLPLRVRASVLLGLPFVLGVGGLLRWGPMGMGLAWLVVFSVLTTALAGLRAGLFAVAASLASVAIIGAGLSSGRIALEFDGSLHAVAASAWIDAVVGIAFAAGIAVAFLGRARRLLSEALHAAAQRAAGLRRGERRLRTLVQHAAESFILHDLRGRIVDVSRSACESLGYTRAELLSMVVADVDAEAPTDRDDRRFWGPLAPGESVTVEGVHRRKDGSTFPVELHLERLDWGGREAILAVARDISERKWAEVERERLEAQLRQAQKMETVGRLATGLAHDFNNSLMVILGNAEMAHRTACSGEDARAEIAQIIWAAEQASELSGWLLALSRQTTAHASPVDLAELVRQSTRILQRILPAAVEMAVEIPEADDLWIEADEAQLNQVLMNLVIGARDAMPDGGQLCVAVRHEPPDASGASPAAAGEGMGVVMLSVSDTGIGMSEQDLARVRDPLFTKKARVTKKARGQGTGLGMSVVHDIVETHHGRMHVESEVGRGTSVRIEFPRCEPLEACGRRPSEPAAPPRVRGTVLVADDDRQVRAIMAAAFDAEGWEVIQAADGAEALRIFRAQRDGIDLVILDVDMPNPRGGACLERMRETRPDLPAIFTGGSHDPASPDGEVPEAVFLRKPFKIVELTRLADTVMSQAAIEEE